MKKNLLSIYAKSFNWAGFFLPKKIYQKCSSLYDFCRTIDDIADQELRLEIKKQKFKDLVIEKMEQTLLPNLRENIVEDFYLTPDYFEKDLNTKYGSGFSIQPKFSQSAYFRFHNKSEVCDGLYFVGAGTHPGAGVPGVLSSAKVLDKIL